MIIPKYVQNLMERSAFAIGYGDPGYTLEIRKETHYTHVSTLKAEVQRLQNWVKRVMPEDDLGVPTMVINRVPKETHYCRQCAVVTIYDPVMQKLEKYIKGGK